MALKPIRPRLRNLSNDVVKVALTVPPGDELEVSEDVAAQVAHQRASLTDVDATPPGPKITEPIPEPVDEAPAEPVKKAAKKRVRKSST